MAANNQENPEVNLNDPSGSLVPAEGSTTGNSTEVHAMSGGLRPSSESPVAEELPNNNHHEPASQNCEAGSVSGSSSDGQSSEIEPAPAVVSVPTDPTITEDRSPVKDVQELSNDLIDCMIQRLRSLRTVARREDVEASVDVESTEVIQNAQDSLKRLETQLNTQQSNSIGESPTRPAEDPLQTLPDIWNDGTWRTLGAETRRQLVRDFAFAIIEDPTARSRSPFFSVQFVTIMESIGMTISDLARQFNTRSNGWQFRFFDTNTALGILQRTELIARTTLEIIQVIHRQAGMQYLFDTCSEQLNSQYSSMFLSLTPTLDDLFLIIICLYIVNLETFNLSSWLAVFDALVQFGRSRVGGPVGYIMSLRYEQIEQRLPIGTDYYQDAESKSTEALVAELSIEKEVFCSDDLDIHTLANIKNFRIEWTLDIKQHLAISSGYCQLIGENKWKKILKVYWFPPLAEPMERSYLWRLLPHGLNRSEELEKTIELLFQCRKSYDSPQSKAIRRAYLQMEIPSKLCHVFFWPKDGSDERRVAQDRRPQFRGESIYRFLDVIHRKWPRSAKLCEFVRRHILHKPRYPTMKDYIKRFPRRDHARLGFCEHDSWEKTTPTPVRTIWAYSEFPVFGERLRELRLHMDNTKPHGIRELLKDRRDSLAYYTFWGAVVAGAITIFLTLLGLVVASIQTWAAIKAIPTS